MANIGVKQIINPPTWNPAKNNINLIKSIETDLKNYEFCQKNIKAPKKQISGMVHIAVIIE